MIENLKNHTHDLLRSDSSDGRRWSHQEEREKQEKPEKQEKREKLGEWRAGQAGLPDAHQPIIGIPVPVQQSSQGPLLLADAVGAWAIERMQGRVFLIPLWPFPTHERVYQSLWSLMQSMDGLLLPASVQGTDWYADWADWQTRTSQHDPQTWPLAWEMALAQLATYLGMPILAIADGADKWNCALGGKMAEMAEMADGSADVHDVPAHAAQTRRAMNTATDPSPETWERHSVRVRAQSQLASYLQPALAMQNEQEPWELAFMPTHPHQRVAQLAPGLRSCAQSEETTVVAFERKDAAFGLGIVGRLDWGLDQLYGTALFDAFLLACRSFDHVRLQNHGWESSREVICATVMERVMQGQSLIPVPSPSSGEKRQRSGPISPHLSPHLTRRLPTSPSSANGAPGPEQQVRLQPRQRLQQPTKAELNQVRRQRLKSSLTR